MRYYPLMLDLRDRDCLLVGAGAVGVRKLAVLARCGPREILVLDRASASPELEPLLQDAAIRFERRDFVPADLDGRILAIAATGNGVLNQDIARLCRERNILCNVVDDPEAGSFAVPAHIELEGLILALSTGGQSPALARRIRMELETHLGSRLGPLIRFMGAARPLILALGLETGSNTALFRALVESRLGDLLADGDMEQARQLAITLLPRELHPRLDALMDTVLTSP